MNVYVETNFILELALVQEQHENCERIVTACGNGQAQLVIPAYSLAEPHETLIRRDQNRRRLRRELAEEFTQLRRSTSYSTLTETFSLVLDLLTSSGNQQRQKLAEIRERLLQVGDIIPLDEHILSLAADYESQFDLSPQDALVFASIWQHLSVNPTISCFLTRNSDDFNKPALREALARHNCRIMFSFDDGYGYIQSQH